MKNTLSIVIPAYNEEKSLPVFLPELIGFAKKNSYEIIIVNDGSKDSTLKVLREYGNDINIVSHKVNRGYGGAIKSGIIHAVTDFVITIDADGQHVLDDVKALHDLIIEKDADMVVGSRAKHKSASIYRGIGKSIIRTIAKLLLPVHIHDLNSGMKIYNTKLAKRYISLCPNGMAYSDIIALVFINFRHLVIEHEISIKNRIAGESTIGTMTAIDTVKEIFNIVILFNPLKIFFPVSIFLFLFSFGWGLPIVLRGDGVSVGTMLLFIAGLIIFFIGLIAEQVSLMRKASVLK
jgi:glycosyltransferase involved in cell wall biosynthesis